MSYISDLLNGNAEPSGDKISLDQYVRESAYITKHLSRIVKDKALAVYHVLFILSWYETGKGEIIAPWSYVGSFIRSEQGNIIESLTVRRRLPDLLNQRCITVSRLRGNANQIRVHLPSDIQGCAQLIAAEEAIDPLAEGISDEKDYYQDPDRRLEILYRDNRACVYCTTELSEEAYVLDHLLPISKGGSNRKHNLVASCETCNSRKSSQEPIEFLRENYRQKLISQAEFLNGKDYLETLLSQGAG